MPPLEAPEEERALTAACARRDPRAFETLLGRHAGALQAGCRRALGRSGSPGGRADLEEAVAVVRERLWREAPSVFGAFRFACPLEAWLRLVAFRTALNWARAESLRRDPVPGGSALQDVPAPSSTLEAEEELAALAGGLERLETRDRTLLEQAYFQGLDHREIARLHALAPGSVGSLLARARARLGIIVRTLSREDPSV